MRTLKDIAEPIVQLTSEQGREKGCEKQRCLVAIAGPPGSGKSFLALQLNNWLNERNLKSCVMPMDGFHLDDNILEKRGHLPRKGASHTFDVNGFVDTVARVHANEHTVYVPVFDRKREIAIAGVQEITTQHRIIIVEGNYLLLQEEPWAQLSHYFSYQLFINPGIEVIEQRILERWQDAKLDQDTINRRTYENDLPNARYVLDNSELKNATAISLWS